MFAITRQCIYCYKSMDIGKRNDKNSKIVSKQLVRVFLNGNTLHHYNLRCPYFKCASQSWVAYMITLLYGAATKVRFQFLFCQDQLKFKEANLHKNCIRCFYVKMYQNNEVNADFHLYVILFYELKLKNLLQLMKGMQRYVVRKTCHKIGIPRRNPLHKKYCPNTKT